MKTLYRGIEARNILFGRVCLGIWVMTTCSVCGDDAPTSPMSTPDVLEDVYRNDAQIEDIEEDPSLDVPEDLPPTPPTFVDIDLAPYIDGIGNLTEGARAAQIEDLRDLLAGDNAQGQRGDYVLENNLVRAIIERDVSAISPCPYGGNIIDSAPKRADGTWEIDIVGEVCPLLNVGMTFRPDAYRIVRSGGEGEAAVLAVDGALETWDFLNPIGTAADFLGGIELNIALDPNRLLPFRVSIYYILRPNDREVRVVTALRNDGEEREHTTFGHMIRAGGEGDFFNPFNELRGYGYRNFGASNPNVNPLPFLGYISDVSGFFYTPKAVAQRVEDIPMGGSHIASSGMTIALLGNTNLLEVILTPPNKLETTQGVYGLDPGDVMLFEHGHLISDGSLSTGLDEVYEKLDVDTGSIRGRVLDDQGDPVSDLAVHAVRDGRRAMSGAHTDEDGRFSMRVPTGSYVVRARNTGLFGVSETVDVETAGTHDTEIRVGQGSTLHVHTESPSGDPIPARVSVLCEGTCPNAPTSQDENISNNALPGGFAAIAYADLRGDVEVVLQPGTYRVVVSRGIEWSVWPQDAIESRGIQVTLGAGQSETLQAEIAQVVDASGALGADFHIHAIHSMDSQVANRDRVMNFVSEGVDVMISTDHDYITDYQPVIEELGVGAEVVSCVGSEITTADLGHFNAFPLQRDPSSSVGGALDWSNGPALGLTPREIFEWVNDHPQEQVIQVNHPGGGLGTFVSLGVDPLLGTTRTEAANVRLPEAGPEAKRDALDTGLWDERFTAIEVMGGNGRSTMWANMRWWMTMLSRGFTPTATAVTDTHTLYSSLGGAPRSYVFVSEEHDTPSTFDQSAFVRSVNAGRLVGSNGPFFRASLVDEQGQEATFGDTFIAETGSVQARVVLQTPQWMKVDTLDVYINPSADDIYTPDSAENPAPIPPTFSQPISLGDEDLVEVSNGTLTHRRYEKTLSFEIPIERDAFVVFILRGDSTETPNMYPILSNRSVKPFAFSNPIYIDTDGGGYNTFPFADLVQERLEERAREGASNPIPPRLPGPFLLDGHAVELRVNSQGKRMLNVWELPLDLLLDWVDHHSCQHVAHTH